MKKLVVSLLVATLFVPVLSAPSSAATRKCETEDRSAEVPSGSHADATGRTWVGFKEGGLPPDSLSKSDQVTVCEDDSFPG